MAEFLKGLSVSEAASLCRVGRTTVGYWIRAKKIHATRLGRNYTIAAEDLIYFLKTTGQDIPAELQGENQNAPVFKSFQSCWQYWNGSKHGLKCHGCIAFRNQLQACFTVKDSGLLGCSGCSTCRYYLETFLTRIQFVEQIEQPAAVFKDLYLWGGNSSCAELCNVPQKELIGMGIEEIVHTDSLPKVIQTIRKLTLGDPGGTKDCVISLNNSWKIRKKIRVVVYVLREPVSAFLVLGAPLDSR